MPLLTELETFAGWCFYKYTAPTALSIPAPRLCVFALKSFPSQLFVAQTAVAGAGPSGQRIPNGLKIHVFRLKQTRRAPIGKCEMAPGKFMATGFVGDGGPGLGLRHRVCLDVDSGTPRPLTRRLRLRA
jgi:hypothetical protein